MGGAQEHATRTHVYAMSGFVIALFSKGDSIS